MTTLNLLVTSLVKPKAGSVENDADKSNIIFDLREFSAAQRQRGIILSIILIFLLVVPVFLSVLNIEPQFLPYLIGTSGIFAAGTVKLLVDAFQDLSRSHTLAVICQNLDSADAREVLVAWLGKK